VSSYSEVTYLPQLHILTILYAALIIILCGLAVWIIHHSFNKAFKRIPAPIVRDLEVGTDLFIAIIGIAAIYSVLGITLNVFLLLVLLILVGAFIAARDLLPTYLSTYVIRSSNAFKPGDWIEYKNVQGNVLRVDNFYTVVQSPDGMLNFVSNFDLFKNGFSVFSPISTKYAEAQISIYLKDFSEELLKSMKATIDEIDKAAGKGDTGSVTVNGLRGDQVILTLKVPVTNPKKEGAVVDTVLTRLIEELKKKSEQGSDQ